MKLFRIPSIVIIYFKRLESRNDRFVNAFLFHDKRKNVKRDEVCPKASRLNEIINTSASPEFQIYFQTSINKFQVPKFS